MSAARERQLRLDEIGHGGFRVGAGRKKDPNSGVPHDKREVLSRHHPVHVTMRVAKGLPSLRRPKYFKIVSGAMSDVRGELGLHLVHFSVQGNHIHAIVEADDEKALTRGMRSLTVRLAIRLNKALRRTGQVFVDRFHAHVLKTPTEVRRALAYVLNNWRKHAAQWGRACAEGMADVFSSGLTFLGWKKRPANAAAIERVPWTMTSPARTWLLREGWRKAGLIDTDEVPGRR